MEKIKDRLQEMMDILDIKQADISRKTGIPKQSISHYIHGRVEPKQDRIYQICRAYGVDEAWLLGYDVPMFPSGRTAALSDSEWKIIRKYRTLDHNQRRIIDELMESIGK